MQNGRMHQRGIAAVLLASLPIIITSSPSCLPRFFVTQRHLSTISVHTRYYFAFWLILKYVIPQNPCSRRDGEREKGKEEKETNAITGVFLPFSCKRGQKVPCLSCEPPAICAIRR